MWRLDAGYLRVAWRGDRRRLAREAAFLGRLRGVVPAPEVLDCAGDDRLSALGLIPLAGQLPFVDHGVLRRTWS